MPAPPRANTTLSEFDMLAAAAQARWRMEDDTQYDGSEAADLCRASGTIQDVLN